MSVEDLPAQGRPEEDLPAQGRPEEDLPAQARPEGAQGRPEGTKVLVVEDEESFLEALLIGLEREGFAPTVARDGAEAIAKFDESRPEVVLLDVMLPKMSGIDVCRAIRARSNVPIIMVSAKSTEIDTVVGLEVGADDYVTKPYRLRELASRMRAVLRRSDSRDSQGGDAAETSTSAGRR